MLLDNVASLLDNVASLLDNVASLLDNVASLLDETFDDFDPRELPPVTLLEGE